MKKKTIISSQGGPFPLSLPPTTGIPSSVGFLSYNNNKKTVTALFTTIFFQGVAF